MNKKAFLTICYTSLVVFLPLFIYLLFFSDPRRGPVIISLFLASVFFVAMALYALSTFALRQRLGNNELLFENTKSSLRQGFFLGIFFVGVLGLAALSLLTWWDALLLAFSLVLFEVYFKSGKERKL